MQATIDQVGSLEHQKRSEEANLSDSNSLSVALAARLARLQVVQDDRISRPPDEVARDLLRIKQGRKRQYIAESKKLRKALVKFINDHLGSMVAAEELGGPVVGELDEIDDDTLATGFSTQGRPKTVKASANGSSAAKRQRIDEIWGRETNGRISEHNAACEELISLVDDLVAGLTGNSESGVYVDLKRDSAAARFLVRAKVAQYHPRDARKLRLIDFGRELDN
jgi:hypothetical protein